MGKLTFSLFLLLLLHFQLNFSSSLAKTCHSHESSALLKFKDTLISDEGEYFCNSIDEIHPLNETWVKGTNCCSWEGVTCHWLTGYVISLDLSCRALTGTINPSNTLFLLSHLQRINFAQNELSGLIPSGFGSFKNLTHLNLSNCFFSGKIPLEMSRLSKLVSLDISFNSETNYDSDPEFDYFLEFDSHGFEKLIKNLTNLDVLDLSLVNMSLVSPNVLLNLSSSSSIKSIHLSQCLLQGKLVCDFSNFHSLEMVDFSYNFNLMINISEANWFSSLKLLDLHETGLFGDLLNSISNLKSLQYLDLSLNELISSIPESFGNLKSLKYLDLSNNNFFSSIPSSLGNLKYLKYLDLSFNNFFGSIPPSIGNLKILKYVDASFTNFSGSIPTSLGNLKFLEYLDLSFSNFSGSIPESLGNLKKLKSLALKSNHFVAQIPDSFGNLSKLEEFDLSNNQLHGLIPIAIFELVNLKSLVLSSNNLNGIIYWNMLQKLQNLEELDLSWNSELSLRSSKNVKFNLPYLESLALSSCNITKFPYFLKSLGKLTYLDLSNNKIHGRIVKQKSKGWESLSTLKLSHNFLTGIEQYPWNRIQTLDLSFNLLKGSLPVPPISTVIFFVSNNKLSGKIPSSVCNLSSLVALDLSNNDLAGLIPKCFEEIVKFLFTLDLQNNNFYGRIPEMFANDSSLVYFNANGNKLKGSLPRSLVNCSKLQVLDLGNNEINDTFPHWMENLLELQILILRSNNFHGTIGNPISASPFPVLQVLDLSHNEFTGILPRKYLENMKYLIHVDEDKAESKYAGDSSYYFQDSLGVELIMKGLELEMKEILTIFTAIDFSSNKFQGDIPEEIGMLKSLVVLNCSHNDLTGHIPLSLRNLKELESLDLSFNKLVGQIPQQLTVLTFLAVLNLSYNQLNGHIPEGNQFSTFSNDSYIGNFGLCGFPMSEKCNNGEFPRFDDEEKEDSKGWFDWKIALMGYGCGLVFGLSMGYIVFAIGKPQWFVRMIEGNRYQKVRKRNLQLRRINQ